MALILFPFTAPLGSVDLRELLPQNIHQPDLMPTNEWPSVPPTRVTLWRVPPPDSENLWLIDHVLVAGLDAAVADVAPQHHPVPIFSGEVAQSTGRPVRLGLRV